MRLYHLRQLLPQTMAYLIVRLYRGSVRFLQPRKLLAQALVFLLDIDNSLLQGFHFALVLEAGLQLQLLRSLLLLQQVVVLRSQLVDLFVQVQHDLLLLLFQSLLRNQLRLRLLQVHYKQVLLFRIFLRLAQSNRHL